MRVRHVSLTVAAVILVASCSSDSSDNDPSTSAADTPSVPTTEPDAAGPAATPVTSSPETSWPDTSAPASSVDPAAAEFVSSPVEWGPCEDVTVIIGMPAIECGTIEVPLDYSDPAGPTIPLALIRQPALGGDRIGSVVFNPGGPGGSGIEFLSIARLSMPADVTARFDLVSFDPRGVGDSAAVHCDITRDDGVGLVADDDRSAWNDLYALNATEAATCTTTTDGLAPLVGTNNAARDLDEIREAIGDDLLTYVGFSYGTRLGATYAGLFPDHIRALVLDGAVAPSTDFAELGANQGEAFDAALQAFAASCDVDPDCLLGEFGPTLDAISGLRSEIADVGSFETDEPGRVLTPGELDLAILSALYSQSAWIYLSHALYVAEAQADGTLLQVLADGYLGRDPDGTYNNQVEAGTFINCADDPSRQSADEEWALADSAADRSEWFGELLRASTGCVGVPDPVDPLNLGSAAEAPPILVIGTTGDPATPYDWAVQLADFLDSGVLYTVEGEGHTAYTSIECVQSVVDDYLIDLTVPEAGGRCTDTSEDDLFPPLGESDLEKVVAFMACARDEGAEIGEVTFADALRDPSGLDLIADLIDSPGGIVAIQACQQLLPS